MTVKLFLSAILKFIVGGSMLSLLLFLPAGTFKFPNAWLFLALLLIPMFIAGIVMMFKNPELLKKRLDAKEDEATQKWVMVLSGIMFILGFIAAGLDFRFKISSVPRSLVVFASILFIAAYIIYAEVLRENTYLSRKIEVQKNQKVVDTGLYGIVRHPMYAATILLFLAMPLILGSYISFAIFLIYPIIIIMRIRNEEELLIKDLYGYKEYKTKVRYRLIPFIW